jgi:hypothetical protein
MINPSVVRSLSEDSKWLTDHYEEVRDHGEKVIAVKGKRIILETSDYGEMLKKLTDSGEDTAFVLIEVIPSKDDAFIL